MAATAPSPSRYATTASGAPTPAAVPASSASKTGSRHSAEQSRSSARPVTEQPCTSTCLPSPAPHRVLPRQALPPSHHPSHAGRRVSGEASAGWGSRLAAVDDPADRVRRQILLRQESRRRALGNEICEVGLRMGGYEDH